LHFNSRTLLKMPVTKPNHAFVQSSAETKSVNADESKPLPEIPKIAEETGTNLEDVVQKDAKSRSLAETFVSMLEFGRTDSMNSTQDQDRTRNSTPESSKSKEQQAKERNSPAKPSISSAFASVGKLERRFRIAKRPTDDGRKAAFPAQSRTEQLDHLLSQNTSQLQQKALEPLDNGTSSREAENQGRRSDLESEPTQPGGRSSRSGSIGSKVSVTTSVNEHVPEQSLKRIQQGPKREEQNLKKEVLSPKNDEQGLKTNKQIQHQDQVKDLQKALADVCESNAQLERKWKKAALELSRLTQQGPVHKVDDESLKRSWFEIRYCCRNWASTHCSGGFHARLSPDLKQVCTNLTSEYPRYIKSARLRPFLVQAYIMDELLFKVFTSSWTNGPIWAGQLSDSLASLEQALGPGELIPLTASQSSSTNKL
jgi:hypothetical protein